MLIELNGEQRDVPASITLSELIKNLSLAPERLAIELNRRVVRRNDWQQIVLTEGDRVEIVHFVGGGRN
ncbi:MAG TPA: sulfur carrier protein ThiS, partial [Pyrinomonadaceae bacterium]|nr:sulfur carrier protein ThiS [Pyrinomonadaceae bacterium]